MSVGRNDPCPCGSGKKYKKCCLAGEQPKPADLFWHRMHSSRNELIPIILEHAIKTYGKVSIYEAWDEFHLWNDEPFDPESDENQVFMPWFFYDWTPDPDETEVLPGAPKDISPAQSLLNAKGSYLDPLQSKYIESCLSEPFSFFEVVTCHPGQGYQLKDIFTGEVLVVVEKMGSEHASIGDIIFGKPATVQGLTTFEATATYLIPPVRKSPFIELRKIIESHHKPITKEALREYGFELIELYQMFRELHLNPPMPTLTNTDGDLFVPHKVIFEIDSPEEAFEALKDLNIEDDRETLLRDAEFDSENKLIKIEIAWLKKGNKQNKSWENTVLGHLKIDTTSLTAEVNSEKRAKKIQKLVKERMGDGAHYKTTVVESVESSLNKRTTVRQAGIASIQEEEARLFAEHPEIQAKIAEMNAAHWNGWIHEKVPALGNKTPVQAAKTENGKEMLNALLTQFEREAVNRPQAGVNVETFKKIRKQLKLSLS
jgi:hypothetical protein